MKKNHILLFAFPILASTIFYLPFWWSIAALGALVMFIVFKSFNDRLAAMRNKNTVLESQLELTNTQLEHATIKEEKAISDTKHVQQKKQELLSVLSHEIRTPLNGVLGMTWLLKDTAITKEQEEYVSSIRTCSENLLTTVNNILARDVLDYAKLQQVENKLEYKQFELRDCIEEVLGLFVVPVGEKRIDLIYQIAADVPEQILGDNKRLRQVLVNLVDNAVKFTHQGEILVSVYKVRNDKPGSPPQLCFEIKDSGIGIPEGDLSHLLNGIKVRTERSSKPNSNGLGLVICRQLVELMGGQLKITSELHRGTEFSFVIPVIPGNIANHHLNPNNTAMLEGKQILVVDDNATLRDVLIKQLKTWNMSPVFAESGKQALALMNTKKDLDLVLTDIDMPFMDGIQFAQSIRDMKVCIPVIGMIHPKNEEWKPAAGLFTAVINKPIRQIILKENIIRAISNTIKGDITNVQALSTEFSSRFPMRILVVEDNIINQKIIIKTLAKLGYNPLLANNGREAIEMISEGNYDLVLMDVQMPEMDGLEATRMIRTCIESQPVIIAMTANVMEGDRDACIQSGMDDYISKPIELNELLNQLEKWAPSIKQKKRICPTTATLI